MLLNFRKIENKQIIFVCNVLIALFFVTVLTFKKGYSYVPMMLGIIATLSWLFYRFKRKIHWQMDKEEKYFIFSLITYFLTFVMSAVFNGDGFREIDNPSRILLLIPLIFFFKLYPIKKTTLLHFVPIGGLVAGLLAAYQTFVLKLAKPFPGIMSIQAGDIAIVLGLFSIAISFYWFAQKKNSVGILYIIFAGFGMLASILTGARGGWIAFPFCFLLILLFNAKQLNKKILTLSTLLLVAAISFFIYKPEFGIQKRYNAGKQDIARYLDKGYKNSSLGARLDIWQNAFIAITDKPILGNGSSGYEIFKKKQVESKKMAKSTSKLNSLHNQYLEALVKRGIIGFIGLMAILLVPLIIFIRRLKSDDIAIKCIAILGVVHIISHMFFFLSQSFLAHNSGSIFYFFILILFYHLIKKTKKS